MNIPLAEPLVKRFIKEPDNIRSAKTRRDYSTLSSVCGMFCNIFLFAVKIFAGIVTSSIAVISDAFNNLADCASCVITLLGCRFAAKPADKEHPFGHGRMEYLTAMGVSAVILFMGAELLVSSVKKIIKPETTELTALAIVILLVSVGVKLWMFAFNNYLGKRIDSTVLKAVARDSAGDSIATSAAALSLMLSSVSDLPFDGIAGAAVSLLILRSGIEILKETVDELLGRPADSKTVEKIEQLICSHRRVIGVHDILTHNYGPSRIVGSCDVEISDTENIKDAHELVDTIERDITEQLGIAMTIHIDPVAVNDEKTGFYRRKLTELLSSTDERLSFHDLRASVTSDGTRLSFDLSVPYELEMTDRELEQLVKEAFELPPYNAETVMTIDRF